MMAATRVYWMVNEWVLPSPTYHFLFLLSCRRGEKTVTVSSVAAAGGGVTIISQKHSNMLDIRNFSP